MIHIGVLSPVTGGFYFGDVLAGVVAEVAAAGGRVTVVQTLDAGRTGDEFVPAPDVAAPVAWDAVDGFVAIAQAASEPYLRRLLATGKPLVLTSNTLDLDVATVVADNRSGVRHAVSHLVEHGHRHIAFVGNLAQTDMRERYDSYLEGLREHGLEVSARLFVPTPDHVETGGAAAADAVRALLPRVTAVVTSTDRIALGLMAALERQGVHVPADLALVGFDDVEAGWRSTPPLATVNQQIRELGVRAGRLVLAQVRGEQVATGRHSVESTFLPRRSCGCTPEARALSGGEPEAEALVGRVLALVDRATADEDGELGDLEQVLEEGLAPFGVEGTSPETLERFTTAVVQALSRRSVELAAAGRPGADLITRVLVRTSVLLTQLVATAGMHRSDRLSVSLVEQYDVGMGLLTKVGADPSDLSWLSRVSVRLGCLGLWDGPPAEGRLRVAGVYDPGRLSGVRVGDTVGVEQFPPPAVVDHADPSRQEVAFVLQVRGTGDDHGLLCVVGTVDTQAGTGRATYNHWAALLGVALKEQALLEDVRASEERYSLAASATEDGLWDWDVAADSCFFSARCRHMISAPAPGHEPDLPDSATPAGPSGGPDALAPWLRVVHPDDVASLRAELRRAVVDRRPFEVEHRMLAEDGTYRWTLCRALPVGDVGLPARRVVGSLSDIHPRKELEEQLRQAALYDAVTGLPNRRLFLDRLSWAVEQSRRGLDAGFAVVFLDLDGFKLVNDSLGHLVGDELLRTVADRLRADLRSVDTAARFGGDEFAVLLFGLKHDAVLSVVERVQERIAAPVVLAGHEVSVTASVGIATSESGYTDAEDVLRDADMAMYHAKESDRGTASLFDPAMHVRATGRLRAQSELRAALAEQQFVVHYQPMVALDGSSLHQFEALVRWEHPTRGVLLPGEFLPVMAETGTIVTLGAWIIDAVCAEIARWLAAGPGPVSVSVNLSHREFWNEELLVVVAQALVDHRIPPGSLVLEITESVIMSDPDAARQIMADLRSAGVRLHIDDFGTGHSSLHALQAFPVDALKIDQSFVQRLDVDAQTTELVRIIVAMGRTLGLEVVAEGVETAAQAERLRSMGCATAQGWLFARALPGPEAGALLGARLAEAPPVAPTQRDGSTVERV